ncbi:hypothetical protein [Sphingomonas sp.]|uniref:hypothetical protein n=1 Tax=Sphingomonas sp. TaxID=28214 RepID=UPI003AFFA33B
MIVLADTRPAGRIVTRCNTRQVGIAASVEAVRERTQASKGWVFLVGADSGRLAVEHSAWSHGAFTECPLQGLAGEAAKYDHGRAGGGVTVDDLRAFMAERKPDIPQRVLGVAERPAIATDSGDPDFWDLVVVNRRPMTDDRRDARRPA